MAFKAYQEYVAEMISTGRKSLYKRYDVITFDDGDKVVVLEALLHDGIEYVYVNEILPDESDITDAYKVMEVHPEDGTLEKVTDESRLLALFPKFHKLLEKYVK